MKALRAYHQELVDIYSFAIEVDSALMTWNSRLKELVGSSGTTERNTLYFGERHPNDPAARDSHAWQRGARVGMRAGRRGDMTAVTKASTPSGRRPGSAACLTRTMVQNVVCLTWCETATHRKQG